MLPPTHPISKMEFRNQAIKFTDWKIRDILLITRQAPQLLTALKSICARETNLVPMPSK